MSHYDRLIDLSLQQLLTHLLSKGGMVSLQEITFAVNGFDNPLALQFGVSLGNSIAVYAKLFGEWPKRWQRISRAQLAGGGGITDLVSQLEVDGLAGLEIDLKDHSLYCYTT